MYLEAYQQKSQKCKSKRVRAAAYCEASCCYQLTFRADSEFDHQLESVICSPLQEFYRITDQQFVSAYALSVGDILLCKDQKTTILTAKESVDTTIIIDIIEVKKYHTFFVTQQKILTHNFFIPAVATVGFCVPFDIIVQAETWGCMFGPVTFCCSIAIAGVTVAVMYQFRKQKVTNFDLVCGGVNQIHLQASDNNKYPDMVGAQALGKPTEDDSFIPKKNWDGKKIRNPNGPGFRWPDENGWVWVPTGPSGHGGPHWDVQIPGKSKKYVNIVPGGKERGKK